MSGDGVFSTSYFSAPSPNLDPTLFENRRIRSWVRQGIMHLLKDFFARHYRHSELWSHPWLAGSGVSYQWSADRTPADLDCLVGVDAIQFRKANPEYAGLTDKEIAQDINEHFREELQPLTADWHGYELTFYVNPGATDIRSINPYAAYDLKYDEWTVPPSPYQEAPSNPEWDLVAENDEKMAEQVHVRFVQALNDVRLSQSDAIRRNAEVRMQNAKQQAEALFEEIHGNRRMAFASGGEGYYDFNNYRWQAAKRSGSVEKLRKIKDYGDETQQYGVELPDTSTLIRRAALYRNSI